MSTPEPLPPELSAFAELTASRRAWIQEVLVPWCRTANVPSLLKAEMEWGDIAGRVDPQFSLWLWAWSRFPVLYVEGLKGLDETYAVQVTSVDGTTHTGYPDARASSRAQLILVDSKTGNPVGPLKLDRIASIERVNGE